MDWGFDFYAPQSMVAPDGRRLIVAWANEWEWMPLFKDWGPTYQEGWCGFFNVIREVRMCKDGTLAFVPVEEMEKIRENKFTQREIQITETPQQLKAGDGISFEMKFTLDLEETDADRVELKLESKVNLKLWVKVKKDWRDSDFLIKNFGYDKKEI